MRIKSQNEAGLGLIEVTIALLIFMVGLLSLAQTITLAITLNKKNRENLIVSTLCKDKIEQLLSLDFDDDSSNTAEPPQPLPGSSILSYSTDGTGLSDGGTIAPDPPSDDPPGKFYRDY